jgi:FtsZ-binding cell division protein ZapB
MDTTHKSIHAAVSLALVALAFSGASWGQASPDADKQVRNLKREVNTLRTELKTLSRERAAAEQDRKALQAQIRALREQVLAMREDVRGLKANSILDLNGYLTFENTSGYPTAVFRGVNVQVVNGMGETQTANGVGNLIVGYNRARSGQPVCSIGYFATQAECSTKGGHWAVNHKSGSHNIVGGDFNSYSLWGGLLLGTQNAINAPFSVVAAGSGNVASGDLSSITGGSFNTSSAMYGSVAGGLNNSAKGEFSSVGGGSSRHATGSYNWASGALFQQQ